MNNIMANADTMNNPSEFGSTNDLGIIFERYLLSKKATDMKYMANGIKAM
jgi:hypothetical protein